MGQAEDPKEPRPSDHYPRPVRPADQPPGLAIRAAAGSAAGFVLYRGWGLPSCGKHAAVLAQGGLGLS